MQPDTIAEHVRRLVDQAPPLTEDQRTKLSCLLRPESGRPAIPAPREAA